MVCEYRKLAPILCPHANGDADYNTMVKRIKFFGNLSRRMINAIICFVY